MRNIIIELNTEDLDAVSGGLPDNPFKDAENQRVAANNGATNHTIGGSITGQFGFGGGATQFGGEATGGNPV